MLDRDNLKRHPNWRAFGKMLRQFRKRLSLQQTHLVQVLPGYVNSVISKLEGGSYPHATVDDIAHRLGALFIRTGAIRSAQQMREWLELIFDVVTPYDIEGMIAAARERPLNDIDPVITGTWLEIIDAFASTLDEAFPVQEPILTTIVHESTDDVSVTPIDADVAPEISEETVPGESTPITIVHESTEGVPVESSSDHVLPAIESPSPESVELPAYSAEEQIPAPFSPVAKTVSTNAEPSKTEHISAKQQTTSALPLTLLVPPEGFTIYIEESFADKYKRLVRESLQAVCASLLRKIIFSSYLTSDLWKSTVEGLVRFGSTDSSVNTLFEMVDITDTFLPLFKGIDIAGMSSPNFPYYEIDRPRIYRARLVELVYSCAKRLPMTGQVDLYEKLALRKSPDYSEMVRAVRALEAIGDFSAIRSLEHVVQQSQHYKVAQYAKNTLADLSTPAAAAQAAYKLELARRSSDKEEQYVRCRAARKILRDGKRIHHQTYTVLVDALQRVINDPDMDEETQLIAADALKR